MVLTSKNKFTKITNVDQMLAAGNELKSHPHPKVRTIGEKVCNTFSLDISDENLGVAILDIIGSIVSFIPGILGGLVIGAGVTLGVMMIIISVLCGCLLLVMGEGSKIIISPTARKNFFKNIQKSKNVKIDKKNVGKYIEKKMKSTK